MNIFFQVLGAVFVLIGIIFVYDARPMTKKFFGNNDQNEGALGLKLFGFLFVFVGGLLLLFYL